MWSIVEQSAAVNGSGFGIVAPGVEEVIYDCVKVNLSYICFIYLLGPFYLYDYGSLMSKIASARFY